MGLLTIALSLLIGGFVLLYSKAHVQATIKTFDTNNQAIEAPANLLFASDQDPSFLIESDGLVEHNKKETQTKEFKAAKGTLSAVLKDTTGQVVDNSLQITSSDTKSSNFVVALQSGQGFRPGKYTLSVDMHNGTKSQTVSQDFSWGVLAVNFDKSSYQTEEPINIGIGVLDDKGHTLCDASVKVTVSDPTGKKTDLSTDAKNIVISPTCADKNVTTKPDYSTTYNPTIEGQYSVAVEANTATGIRTLHDSFRVTNSSDIVVTHKDTAMRIYPVAEYKVTEVITTKRKINGGVKEKIPYSFQLKDISNSGVIIDKNEQTQTISWPLTLDEGQTFELSYTYKAPTISPEFYLLGPMQIWQSTLATEGEDAGTIHEATIFSEPRAWQIAVDGVSPIGSLVYGDTTNAGTAKVQAMTATGTPDTFGAEFSLDATAASNIAYTVAHNAPTRDEVMIGTIRVDGQMDIRQCTGGCDAATDDDSDSPVNKAGVAAAMTCDATFGSCWRPFDIAYEQLSGDAMVAFGLNATTGTLQYCQWTGSAWSPTSCTTPSTFALNSTNCGTALTGAIRWVRLIPRGEKFKDVRTDEMLAIVEDANSDMVALRWSGSAWGNCNFLTATSSGISAQNFDGAWENTTGNAMVVWAEGTSAVTTPFRYKIWTRSNTTWGSAVSMTMTNSRIGHWVRMAGSEIAGKNHIAIIVTAASALGGTTGNTVPYIWDGSSLTKGTEWGSIENSISPALGVAVESISSVTKALYFSSLGANTDETGFETWTEGSGFSGGNTDNLTNVTDDLLDDAGGHFAVSAPDTNDIFLLANDWDDALSETRWDRATDAEVSTGWQNSLELALAPVTSANAHNEGQSYTMSPRPYGVWSRNWRFYSDVINTNPSTGLGGAAANATPTSVTPGTFTRLRLQFTELAGLGTTDTRKSLQYTSGCTPNTSGNESSCTWTDVGDTSNATAVFRYATAAETCTDCTDNGNSNFSTVLSGSTQSGAFVSSRLSLCPGSCGNMDHTAGAIVEYDYPLMVQNTAVSTTYYFRAVDSDGNTYAQDYIYRRQDTAGATDCGGAACTYPSLTTGAGVTVSGNAYADEATTAWVPCDGSAANISIVVNGNYTATTNCADVGGAYSFANVPVGTNYPVAVLFNTNGGNTDKGSTTTIAANGTSALTLNPRKNIIWVQQESGAISMTTSLLDKCSTSGISACSNAPWSGSSVMNIDSGKKLYIAASSTLSASGTITQTAASSASAIDGDVQVEGTLNMNSNSLTVGGDLTINGTYSKASSAQSALFNASGTGYTITPPSGSSFGNLLATCDCEYTVQTRAMTVDGDLTVGRSLANGGTLKGSQDITVNGGDFTCGSTNTTATINLTGGTVTIDGTGNFGCTSAASTVNNLTLGDGTGTDTTTLTQTGDLTISGDLTVSANQTMAGSASKTVTISGGDIAGTGTINMTGGTIVLDGTGNFGSATNWTFNNLTFGDGSGTTTTTSTGAGTATVTGDLTVAANQTLGGTKNFTVNGEVIGAGTVTLTSASVFIQKIAAAKSFGSSTGSNNWTFYDLRFENSTAGDLTVTTRTTGSGQIIVSGTLSVGNASDTNVTTLDNVTNDRILDVNGNVSITSKGTLQASDLVSFTVAGNWTNNGTFTAGTGGNVTFDGAAQQTLSGTMTTTSAFYNLTLTNSSGVDDPGCGTSFTPGIIFGAAATSTNNYIVTTASVRVQYLSTATYTFNNINWNGQATGTKIFFRNSSLSSGTWLLKVTGTQTAVSYVNVGRSDASVAGGSAIVANDGTNVDCNNNTNWTFGATNPTFNQVNYRFGSGTANNISYTSAPAENTALTVTSTGQDFRLRMSINVGTATLTTAAAQNFKLRFGEKPAGGCSAATYADVAAGSGVIRYVDIGGLADGDNIALVTGDPNFTGTERYQDYEESNNFTNSVSDIASGENGIWDFSLENNSSVGSKTYCFKATKSDGTDLDTYTNYPEVIIDEELTFSLDSTSKDFGVITPGAAPTDQTSTLTTTSNAASGYQITLWSTQLLTKPGGTTIANWTGTNTTPTTLSGTGASAFGYSTSDSNLGGGTATRFTSAADLFAGFTLTGPGDIVADNATTPIASDSFTTTYRLRTSGAQDAGTYSTTLIYICTATY